MFSTFPSASRRIAATNLGAVAALSLRLSGPHLASGRTLQRQPTQSRALSTGSTAAQAMSSRWAVPAADGGPGGMRLAEVQKVLDAIAPLGNAAQWDNVGLLLGTQDQLVQRALVTIDLTAAVLEEAAEFDADLIVAYHPPIFSATKRLTSLPLIQRAAAAGCAIYSPHTALDAAPGGTNDVLAQQLGLQKVAPLTSTSRAAEHKLVVFVPAENVDEVLQAMHAAGAGVIGEYDCCAFRSPGTGSFRGSQASNPHIGTAGEHEMVAEVRVEVVVPPGRLDAVVAALRGAHPYEEPAFDVFARETVPIAGTGMGRIGSLGSPLERADALARHVKDALGLQAVMVAAPLQAKPLCKVALCAGSGSDMLDDAVRAGADALVTGEMSHHSALKAVAAGVTVVTTLHSNSERGALGPYAERIREVAPALNVLVSSSDRDPFTFVV